MSVNSILKRENLSNIEPLSMLDINKIAKTVSNKICDTFPEHNINRNDLFISIARLNMFTAKMLDTSSSAKYFYKNNSIYFNDTLNLNKLDSLSIHECIHFMQELRNENGKLIKMGLYNINSFMDTGLAINEAAVQTMASICSGAEEVEVKYYNMDIKTISPDYYPIECALLNQMIYFTGSYPLFHSTLFSDDVFKNTFIEKSDFNSYYFIENNFDILLEKEEKLSNLVFELQNSKDNIKYIKRLNIKIQNIKKEISNLCISTQNLIIKSCFTKELNSIKNMEDLKAFQEHLYNFKDILIYADNTSFYNQFYCDTMAKLEEKREHIKYGIIGYVNEFNNDLAVIENHYLNLTFFKNLLAKLKLLFKIQSTGQKMLDK